MKNSVILLFLSLLATLAQAQPEVVWGPRLKEGRNVYINSVPGILDGNFYIYKFKGGILSRRSVIQRLNEGMAPVKEESLDLRLNGETTYAPFCLQFGGELYLFGSRRDPQSEVKHLVADQIDRATLQLKGQVREMASIPMVKRNNPGDFHAVFSRDSTRLLIVGIVNSKNKDPEKYNLYVYGLGAEGQGMVLEWQKEVTLDIPEKYFTVEDFVVDNAGNVYLTGEARIRRPTLVNDDYHYLVMAYREQGQRVEEYEVSLKPKFITDLLLAIAPGGDLICAGFYSERGYQGIKGSYYLVIDKASGGILSESTWEFELDFITMNFTEVQERRAKRREAKGKNVELYRYRLDRIIARGDGGAVLTAEQYYTYTYTVSTPGVGTAPARVTTHTRYVYNDVIIVSIDPEGQIEWATKIPKRQRSTDDNGFFSSYAMMITSGTLHFIFNDTDRNIEIEKQGKIENFNVGDKRGIVMLASVDTEGNVDRRPLFSNREVETITRPKFCRQLSSTEMLLFGQKGRGNQFGRLVFED